ncbi:MAG: RDD family protein [Marivirga sp.]|nr:RDD family protein [Marivirga sp.]
MNTNYAGFWLRFVAVIIDGIILGAVQFVAIMPILGIMGIGIADNMENFDSSDQAEALSMMSSMFALAGITQVVFLIIQTLYYSLMESSNYQASVGKMVLGLKVIDINGNKLDFTKALVRNLSKIISSFILLIGYLMAAFTEKKQALHDMIANTLVVKK